MARLRPIGPDDRLSIVDHLDELRSRLFVCLAVLAVAFGLCFWQNNHLLTVLNRALPDNSKAAVHNGLSSVPSESVQFEQLFTKEAADAMALATAPGTSAQARQAYLQEAAAFSQAAKDLPKSLSTQEKPITLGVGESFTTTLTVAAYFALLFSLPVLIYEGYAFVIPALSRTERRVGLPGDGSGAAVVPHRRGVHVHRCAAACRPLPPGLQQPTIPGPRPGQVVLLVRDPHDARGSVSPSSCRSGCSGSSGSGVINGSTLTRHWRYATVIIAVIAAAMPGPTQSRPGSRRRRS